MTTKKYNKISNAFNTETEVEENKEIAVIENKSKELSTELKDSVYEFAQNNIKRLLEKGEQLLDSSMNFSLLSEEPRSVKVTADILKILIESNEKLLDNQIKKNIIEGRQPNPNEGRNIDGSPKPPINISGSNVVVANANDLQTQIRRRNGEDVDKVIDMNELKGGKKK